MLQTAFQQQQQQQPPTITMGNTVSNRFGDTSQTRASEEARKPSPKKPEAEKNKKGPAQDGAQASGGGWFGGIFSKLSMKPKNQMILPDDKNPTVSFNFWIIPSTD